ncbi:MAG: FtsX-like permease family protein [Lachnospiraceae bacterium]|nr:FtsX-like permease family protein [Lachnospiraceae bacterium]
MYLLKKLSRELWLQKKQFFAIFMMSFLGIAVLVGMDAESAGDRKSMRAYYEETNMADYHVEGRIFSREDLRLLRADPAVRNAQRSRVEQAKLPDLKQGDKETDLIAQFVEENAVSRPRILEGEAFDAGGKGIWLEAIFARANHLSVGESLTIKLGDKRITQTIRGLIMAPEYIVYYSPAGEMIPDYTAFGYAFLPGSCYPSDSDDFYTCVQLDTKTESEEIPYDEMRAFKDRLKVLLETDDLTVLDRTQMPSHRDFSAEIEQHETFAVLFPGIFLIIAFLGMVTTMTRMTVRQRTVIGTMKALGFSNAAVMLHYVSFGTAISLIGAVLGFAVGRAWMPPLINMSMQSMYTMPDWQHEATSLSYGACIVVVALSTLVSCMTCRRIMKENPASALRQKAPKSIKITRFERSFLWKKLPLSIQWTLREVRQNRLRSMMGLLGVAGCMMIILGAFGCMDSIEYMPDNAYERMMIGRSIITMEDGEDAFTANEYARRFHGQAVEVVSAEFSDPEKTVLKTGSLTVLGDGNLARFYDENGEKEIFLHDGEVFMSRKMAELLDLRPGMLFSFHMIGEKDVHTCRIAGINKDPSTQGISMTEKTFRDLEQDFVPNRIYTNYRISADLSDELPVKNVQTVAQLRADLLAGMDVMSTMINIMVVCGVALGLIVLYNLSELSFVEKERDYTTLKVLGMQAGTVRGIIFTELLVIGVIGILLGVPLGLEFLRLMWTTMGESVDIAPVVFASSYVRSALITIGVIVVSCLLICLRTRHMNMVDALKSNE